MRQPVMRTHGVPLIFLAICRDECLLPTSPMVVIIKCGAISIVLSMSVIETNVMALARPIGHNKVQVEVDWRSADIGQHDNV
jgi:hypothetical protein